MTMLDALERTFVQEIVLTGETSSLRRSFVRWGYIESVIFEYIRSVKS